MTTERHEVAIAILYQNDRFLMQLRDNIPGILYPGHWALFGGHLEPGETSGDAVRRELMEEIGYVPDSLDFFGNYNDISCDRQIIRHVYHGCVTVAPDQLVLGEGWDLDWLTPEEIAAGDRYSVRAQQSCPLGRPHQKMLLDFITLAAPLPRSEDESLV
jgi:8-oxo-dGTP diphosphatase